MGLSVCAVGIATSLSGKVGLQLDPVAEDGLVEEGDQALQGGQHLGRVLWEGEGDREGEGERERSWGEYPDPPSTRALGTPRQPLLPVAVREASPG